MEQHGRRLGTGDRPGQCEAETDPRSTVAGLRARHWALMTCARDILGDEPSPALVRTAARRICAEITQLGEDMAQALANPVSHE